MFVCFLLPSPWMTVMHVSSSKVFPRVYVSFYSSMNFLFILLLLPLFQEAILYKYEHLPWVCQRIGTFSNSLRRHNCSLTNTFWPSSPMDCLSPEWPRLLSLSLGRNQSASMDHRPSPSHTIHQRFDAEYVYTGKKNTKNQLVSYSSFKAKEISKFNIREIFIWVSRSIDFATTKLNDWLKNLAHSFIQSEVKPNSLALIFSRFASATSNSSFDWFTVLSVSFVIG